MTPKVTKEFYRLNDTGKLCYLNGMPLSQCRTKKRNFNFKPEKIGSTLLSSAEQQKIFSVFEKNRPDSQQLTIFASSETDDLPLDAVSHLIHNYIEATPNWKSFSFIGIQDEPPRITEDIQDLYVLIGAHEQDPHICNWVRMWARARLGVPLWICLTAKKPSEWYRESLGIRPHFLFNLKSGGRSIG